MTDIYQLVLASFLLWFSFLSFATGGFTAYYGTGRSKTIGSGLLLFGFIGLFMIVWFSGLLLGVASPVGWSSDIIAMAFWSTLAASAGAVVALVLFLAAIMRS